MTKSWLRYTGLVLPPAAWAVATQLGQITPDVDCSRNSSWTAAISAILLLVSIVGFIASNVFSSTVSRTERFIVDTGFLIAWAFVFALVLQGAASMLLDPCQR